ncbi:hypothetical protein FACS18942_05360 [Planctomycetales bacterium]|nr:hypothetical protein FACS18942_05360 [Planctomycetales bacterium]
MFYFIFLILFIFVQNLTQTASADVFLLKNAGKIEGELLNTEEVPRKTYKINCKIKDVDGSEIDSEIEIEAKYIDRVRKGEREALAEYKKFAPFEEDTVENHLRISKWCRENNLPELTQKHLQCILVLDSENKEARQQLGYTKSADGTWTTRQDFLGRSGYIRDKTGNYKTQQQIDAEEILEKQKKALIYWEKRISQLRQVLPKDTKAQNEILSVNEPEATKALSDALSSEQSEDTRILLVRSLSHIGTLRALDVIARRAVSRQEPVQAVREVCFEELKKHPDATPAIIGLYISQLNPDTNDNITINSAAFALGQLNAKSAVPYLIDALETVHRQKVTVQAPSPAFGSNGNLVMGGGSKQVNVEQKFANTDVLNALLRLTGQNFLYDKIRWKNWLFDARRTAFFDARRGG